MVELTWIHIGNVEIHEPVTVLTDLLVSVVCFYAYFKLRTHRHKDAVPFRLYRWFFFTMGLATAFGGIIGHGFLHYLSFEWKLPGWIISMISVGLAERAAIMHARPLIRRNLGSFLAWVNIFELVTIMFLAMWTLKFIFVEAHALYGLLLILFSFEAFVYAKTRDKGSKTAMWAVFWAALAATTHIAKISPHTWFNYLDLSHVLMAIGNFVLLKAVMHMDLHKVTENEFNRTSGKQYGNSGVFT
ncbi:MAG TPA: hypothetical protein VD905_05970 [Flavobacteriales bacterium]|nr:hypothetical protein [Flavobacteriales bacterium]